MQPNAWNRGNDKTVAVGMLGPLQRLVTLKNPISRRPKAVAAAKPSATAHTPDAEASRQEVAKSTLHLPCAKTQHPAPSGHLFLQKLAELPPEACSSHVDAFISAVAQAPKPVEVDVPPAEQVLLTQRATGWQLASLLANAVVCDRDCKDRKAPERVRGVITWMLQNAPATSVALLSAGLRVDILSRHKRLTELPEWDPSLTTTMDGRSYGVVRGVYLNGRCQIVAGEEGLIECNNHLVDVSANWRGTTVVHEVGHAVHYRVMTEAHKAQIAAAYATAKATGVLPGDYAGRNAYEFWAVLTQCWFNMLAGHPKGHAWLTRFLTPAIVAMLQHYYGEPPSSPWDEAVSRKTDWVVTYLQASKALRAGYKPLGVTTYTIHHHPVVVCRYPLLELQKGVRAWLFTYRKAAENPGPGWVPIGVTTYTLDNHPVVTYRKPAKPTPEESAVTWSAMYWRAAKTPGPGWKPIGVTSYTLDNRPVILYRKPSSQSAADASVQWKVTYVKRGDAPGPGWKPIAATTYVVNGHPVIVYRKPTPQAADEAQARWSVTWVRASTEPGFGWKPIAVAPYLNNNEPVVVYRKRLA